MMQDYWVLFIPFFLALGVIIYFIYHTRYSKKYSTLMTKNIELKIKEIEEQGLVPSKKMGELINLFKDFCHEKVSFFELERKIGIDMETFTLKIDNMLKKN